MVPEGWKVQPLADVLQRISRPVNVKPNEFYTQIGVRSHGKGIFIKEAVEGRELGGKRVFYIEPDCLILNIVFAWEQAVARTDATLEGFIASHRFPMYRPRSGKCNIDYLRYLFLTPRGKYLLGLASPGGAGRNKTLGQKEFERLQIALPPLSEQTKIADILSTWDKAIETADMLLANAEAQKRALMQQLLTGKQRLKGFDRLDWKAATLSSLADIKMGSSPPSSAYNDAGKGLPLLQGNADIRAGYSAPRSFTTVTTQTCLPGDSLLSVRAPVGSVSRSKHRAVVGRGLAIIRARSTREQEWLHHLLSWLEPRWSKVSQGSTFEAVNSTDIRSLEIEVPSESDERVAIGEVLVAQSKVISTIRQDIDHLRLEKAALMQQLLTGRRRVTV